VAVNRGGRGALAHGGRAPERARGVTPRRPAVKGRVRRLNALDTRALDRFLAGVERRAFRTAEIATGNREDALDVVQDAMLKLTESYATRDPEEWGPLFHRILQSRIMDWHRRTRVRTRWRTWFRRGDEDREDPLEQQPGAPREHPDEAVARERTVDRLELALAALPPRQQQAFLLRIWEDLDVADTARAMGCSQGSVKTHLSRAMHSLRGALGEHW
jgi:RNA polymerase sigma-70 factor, ECF subfamily